MDAHQSVELEVAGSTPVLLMGKNYVLKGSEIMVSRRPKRPNPLDESVGPHSSSCTLCGFTGSASAFAGHTCSQTSQPQSIEYSALVIHDEPNRFDPYEALDSIQAAGLEFHDAVKLEKPFKLITVQVLALRAYITGMER